MSGERAWWDLFGGLPVWLQVFFWVVFAITLTSFLSVLTLLISAIVFGRRRERGARTGEGPGEDEFLWIFLVPALNEEVTIADSVERLLKVQATNKVIFAINDGSIDNTAAVLEGIEDSHLMVMTRVPPDAHIGKGAALNAAYRYIRDTVLTTGAWAAWPVDRVIVAVTDADGRLDVHTPERVAWHFRDPRMGGVQLRVRIYNRQSFLTWAQDVEFGSFGLVFQAGRAGWGTAMMGGNGQFNRLSALADVYDEAERGPWRDRLTEDLDLGVRLLQKGWRGGQENGAEINQQGVPNLRRLYRQRTRWAQGNWQCLPLAGTEYRLRPPLAALDGFYYLITPILQLVTGAGLVASIVVGRVLNVPFWPFSNITLVIFLTLGFGPGLLSLLLQNTGWKRIPIAIGLVLPYTVYSWIVFPVLGLGLFRELSGRRTWAKTAREPLPEADAHPAEGDTTGSAAL
ncbi:glycosyltransferase family 2 protein [Rathayibacter sp. YIM 133350]|uniref:glycosyltransferase family 2 protein n=1 Tax=Rathayibacter sp. YIM 133350 TaxID=3131992 RepID=UPI00307DF71C